MVEDRAKAQQFPASEESKDARSSTDEDEKRYYDSSRDSSVKQLTQRVKNTTKRLTQQDRIEGARTQAANLIEKEKLDRPEVGNEVDHANISEHVPESGIRLKGLSTD